MSRSRFRAASAALFFGLFPAILIAAVQDYSTNPNNNNTAPPDGAPEGMAPSTVNDTMRKMMANTAIEAQVNRVKVLNSVAGTNTITASMTPNLTAYSAGMLVVFTPAGNNSGATTINIDSLGALDVQKADGDALVSGDLVSGIQAVVVLDTGADDWILLNPQSANLSNGVAMSDLARLSQANVFTNTTEIESASPTFTFDETDAAANERLWRVQSISGQWRVFTRTDADGAGANAIVLDRTGTTVDSIALTATALTWGGNTLFTSANDGAGSGLDADLLDGSSSAAFAQTAASNTFTSGASNMGPIEVENSAPILGLTETGVTANNGGWRIFANAEAFNVGTINDAETVTANAITIDRTGTTVDSINLQATAVQVNGQNVRDAAFQRIARMRNTNSGAGCTIASDSGITSCTHAATGSYSVDFTAAGFSAAPVCVASPSSSVATSIAGVVSVTSTTASVNTGNDIGGAANRLWDLICMGT